MNCNCNDNIFFQMNSSIKISELSGRDQVEEEDEEQQGNTHQNAYTDLMNVSLMLWMQQMMTHLVYFCITISLFLYIFFCFIQIHMTPVYGNTHCYVGILADVFSKMHIAIGATVRNSYQMLCFVNIALASRSCSLTFSWRILVTLSKNLWVW